MLDYFFILGHGLSSHYPPGMFLTHCDYIYHVKLVIDYFKWEKVTIMGHRYINSFNCKAVLCYLNHQLTLLILL